MNISQFIDDVVAGNASAAKETLNDILSAKAFESIDMQKKELARSVFGGQQESFEEITDDEEAYAEEVENLSEQDIGNGYKMKMKHSDKGRIHAPNGEHVADVTKHESGGWAYHSGNSKWDGSESSPHYKTGVEKTKSEAAKKAAQIHAAN